MTSAPPRPLLRAGAASGALLVAAVATVAAVSVAAVPADARAATACRDNKGWWCLYGKPDLQDGGGLIGTNNGDTDLKMEKDWSFFNDGTRSAINRTDSYVGLYDDIEFKGLISCLPPRTRLREFRGGVSSLRIHPSRGAACLGSGGAVQPELLDTGPSPTAAPRRSPRREQPARPTAKPEPTATPETGEPSPELALPSVDGPASPLPSPPPVKIAVPRSAAGKDGVSWQPVAAVAAGMTGVLALAVLGVGGWVFGRRYRAGQGPRTAADPGAALRVHRALLLLAVDCEQDGREVPKARAVTIDEAEVALHLAAADENAPEPWRVAPGGRRWLLSVADIDEITGDSVPAAPYPLLALVRPGMWVNLAALPGPIALAGNRKAARKAALALARGMRENPWREGVRVRTVGFPPEAVTGPEDGAERGRVVIIDDGMQVPAKTPPGSAVVAVGRPERVGTTWRVRFDGSIVPPAEVLEKDPAPATAGPAAAGAQ
ncbi:peptidase inhibitor family I36 protein [Actinomadura graeca]|uniref:Peptidase inhibitor family I36 protein n=1 Tax=Actinomadura graeca TaxID=2750812 RepID=A0ABX8QTX5_9ACTN|nr:peptidase inhibitor family I36 protein [Actinomadura graeca]QXJ21414.1 peptidase inhibitor family I36 protein [Actinomadura graeca]